ncbi:hypothetical protein CF319_g2751 [Tilletia indica]|uniref:Sugar phosphate transporter domain-containing protein n=2 Tax=Tilletia TaxID=13289 RepID=A0A8X7N3C5_9BASI|nr:hypothetical protein CF319_g2751 [Tilletia indica]KAE8229835.1 hypothetical protein CF326_g5187 [Tilletia indica]KAE8244712.1 hypothetical protein A4X13_0g6336 [Tilletia indica]KAE8265361.1 hypothetical protein A4X09_0g6675 [Tilletia walkeri]
MSSYQPVPQHVAVEVEEKHDPINGHSRSGGPNSPSSQGAHHTGPSILPGGGSSSKGNKPKLHPAFIIALWISLSSSVIVYNKYVLDKKALNFPYPIFLTTWHMFVATIGTRLLARYTNLLNGLRDVEMTRERWLKNILPIGALFSGSLVFSNMAYLTLSVSYIQMLKAFMPVAVLLLSFAVGLKAVSTQLLGIVLAISGGVALASYGEADFVYSGFVEQCIAIAFESSRLVMIQILLQGLKMDPLVSLYFFAPVCAGINTVLLILREGTEPFENLYRLGAFVLFTNAGVAFGLNIAMVFLIGAASSLTLTLAGLFKDILLIVGSMFILGSTVTQIQFLGYGIALAGLMAFKLHKG